ncbi:hypothetical protein [Polaribacter septentrionalilitoris]|uniref:hypothetical protein n=1 Tax=Polaribacter septentrionalilitoris TaxID=2494657 RepID=UPI00135C21BC|nr:hypothetical protein [Polaribacter septentrionalilitoris]
MKDYKNVSTDQNNGKPIKKRKNEPESAKENLDIPVSRIGRPLTNDRHSDTTDTKTTEKAPIENIELDTDPGKEK